MKTKNALANQFYLTCSSSLKTYPEVVDETLLDVFNLNLPIINNEIKNFADLLIGINNAQQYLLKIMDYKNLLIFNIQTLNFEVNYYIVTEQIKTTLSSIKQHNNWQKSVDYQENKEKTLFQKLFTKSKVSPEEHTSKSSAIKENLKNLNLKLKVLKTSLKKLDGNESKHTHITMRGQSNNNIEFNNTEEFFNDLTLSMNKLFLTDIQKISRATLNKPSEDFPSKKTIHLMEKKYNEEVPEPTNNREFNVYSKNKQLQLEDLRNIIVENLTSINLKESLGLNECVVVDKEYNVCENNVKFLDEMLKHGNIVRFINNNHKAADI
jgi:hypothetical protein